MPSPVLDAMEKYRAALDRANTKEMRDLIGDYGRMYRRLDAQLAALLTEIGDKPLTIGQLSRVQRYKALLSDTQRELEEYQALLSRQTRQAINDGIVYGRVDAAKLLSVSATGTEAIYARFNMLHPEAIKRLAGMLADDSPLYARIRKLAPSAFEAVKQAMIEGIGLGYNPRKIARMVQGAFGEGLTQALRTIRTAQIWAYREANRSTFVANPEIVTGWIWVASLDDTCCMSCVAQHGTEHPLDEVLDDHYNGRCAAAPLTIFGNPVEQSGLDWFGAQNAERQREMMGPGKYEAWKDGKFDLSQMTSEQKDEVYGQMRTEATLKELLGE